jgi:hydroxymethylbilane synthase
MYGQKIIIGTRGSVLARAQADIVAKAIRAVEPEAEIEIKVIQTKGDINQSPIPLDSIGKGWFTIEIENALLSGEIQIAQHSLKDMAEDMPDGLEIAAYVPREDARDVLVTKNGESLKDLREGAIVGTDSTRRQIQMLALRPDVHMKSVRGAVVTRIEKLHTQEYDALILAAAGLKRLVKQELISHYFEPLEMTSAPGQGIVALQIKSDNTALLALLRRINDADTEQIATIERSFSAAMGGGCKSPTGAYALRDGDQCHLIGMTATSNGTIVRDRMTLPWSACATLGTSLAEKMRTSTHDSKA